MWLLTSSNDTCTGTLARDVRQREEDHALAREKLAVNLSLAFNAAPSASNGVSIASNGVSIASNCKVRSTVKNNTAMPLKLEASMRHF